MAQERREEGVGIFPFQLKKERYITILLNSYVQLAEITKDKLVQFLNRSCGARVWSVELLIILGMVTVLGMVTIQQW